MLNTPSTTSGPSNRSRASNKGRGKKRSPNLSMDLQCDEGVDEVRVIHKGRECVLAYVPESGRLKLTRITSKGKTKVLLNIPLNNVLNIEDHLERDLRQQQRHTNDDTTKHTYENNNPSAGMLCRPQVPEEDDPLVFAHSRVGTTSSTPAYYHHNTGSVSGTSVPGSYFSNTSQPSAARSGSGGGAVGTTPLGGGNPEKLRAASDRYYVHYVRMRSNEKGTIHSLDFTSHRAGDLVERLLKKIYVCGTKRLVVFISPKSGRGLGEQIFEKQIKPILHFSRHNVETHITTRAHECEDYIADLNNHLDSNCVLVAAGGDGMANEVINGLHRRKLSLIKLLREQAERLSRVNSAAHVTHETFSDGSSIESDGAFPRAQESRHFGLLHLVIPADEVTSPPGDSYVPVASLGGWDKVLPLIATIPTGSACGLAKSMDVLTPTAAALSLVHLHTCHMDILRMQFTHNEEMEAMQRGKMSRSTLKNAEKRYRDYLSSRASEEASTSEQHRDPAGGYELTSPFDKKGQPRFSSAVSMHVGAPDMPERVSFMSLSFGIPNDIDRGSEHLRWMGNGRFAVYGAYVLIRGFVPAKGVLRYLPWESKAGLRVEKLHNDSTLPTEAEFPLCTMRAECSHCAQYVPPERRDGADQVLSELNRYSSSDGGVAYYSSQGGATMTAKRREDFQRAATLSDSVLLDEDYVDFDDPDQSWVTIRGEFYSLLICNLRDVAQDMKMAPLSHLSDGAIDIVLARVDPITHKGGRKEFLQFFTSLENGTHITYPFTNYVKARALEVKVDDGISMSDGEMMPLSAVRITKLRHGIQCVRAD